VNVVNRGTRPLITFSNKGDAWNFMWEKVRSHDLCPKLSGLQLAKGLCFSHQSGTCKGACQGIETPKKYNKRAQQAVDSFFEKGQSVAILGNGRHPEERSLVLVENGNFQGFGYFDNDVVIGDIDSARVVVKPTKENRIVQNLVNSFLQNPRGAQILTF
jgi:DNA polymerase-3 subunit epsilon